MAILFYADGYKFPDVYHVTRFLAPDPIIALEQDGEVVIVANSLEEGRARKESRGVRRVAVGAYFPLGMAERLRGAGIEILVDRELSERRRAKRPDEIAAL